MFENGSVKCHVTCLQKATSGKGENKSCLLEYECISKERALTNTFNFNGHKYDFIKLMDKAAI